MKFDWYVKGVLTVIAVLLGIVALRPVTQPPVAQAASNYSAFFYVEPGTTTVRRPATGEQMEGKVMIDMRNGDIWGFPTRSSAPYPVDPVNSLGPVSTPIYLGKFDLSKTERAPQ